MTDTMRDTTDIERKFTTASKSVKNLSERPDDKTLLHLYGLYKQSTIGNVDTSQPWAFNVENRAKWDSWKLFENVDKHDAMIKYIHIVDKLSNN